MASKVKSRWLEASARIWLAGLAFVQTLTALIAPAYAQSLGQLAGSTWTSEVEAIGTWVQYLFYGLGVGVFGFGLWKMMHHEQRQEGHSAYVRLLLGGALMIAFGVLLQAVTGSLLGGTGASASATNMGNFGINP